MHFTSYTTELTPEESKLGFSVIEFKNPQSKFFAGMPETVLGVAKMIGQSDRIVKMKVPEGGFSFKHQRFGYLSNDRFRDNLDWLPVGGPKSIYSSASHAVQMIESGIADESETDAPKIIPVDPNE